MAGMNLYEITLLQGEMEREEDEDCKVALQEMVDMELANKAVNIVYVLKNFESQEKALDDEIKRLQEKKKIIANKNKRVMDMVSIAMNNMKKDKIETTIGNFTRKISKTTKIEESLLPESAFVISKERKSIKDLKEMGLTKKDGVIDVEEFVVKFK